MSRRHRLVTRASARGLCFYASLSFAREAAEHGMPLTLVRWPVKCDPEFSDHWAIGLGDGRVLDLTSIQFDPDGRLVKPVQDYVGVFGRPRMYPAALFLSLFEQHRKRAHGRLSGGFMWWCARRMARHDLGRAWQQGRPWGGLCALGRLLAAGWRLGVQGLRELLRNRQAELMGRLQESFRRTR